jgi:hypothetical protein
LYKFPLSAFEQFLTAKTDFRSAVQTGEKKFLFCRARQKKFEQRTKSFGKVLGGKFWKCWKREKTEKRI